MGLGNIQARLFSIWKTSDQIGQQAIRGSILTLFNRFAVKGLQFIRTIIIARLLFPEDVGLFGLAALALATFDVLFQTGFNSALVQRKDDPRPYLDAAWTVNLIRNVIIAVALFVIGAPLAAVFFENPMVLPLVRVMSVTLLIAGLENIGMSLLDREMRFNRKTIYSISYVAIELVILAIAAFYFQNVWALVIGAVGGRFAAMIISYLVHPYRPRFSLSLEPAKQLFKYGKWVSAIAFVTFLVNQGDYATIGKLLTTEDLGYYQLAFGLGLLPAVELARHMQQVLFPLYSRIQSDIPLLRRAFVRITRMIFSLTIPASAGLFVLSNSIVYTVYGDRWLPMVPILHVIVLYGFLRSFGAIANPLFMGIGKPQVSTGVLVVQSAILFTFIIPLTQMHGAVGTAWAVFISSVVAQTIYLFMLRKEIVLGLKGFVQILTLPVLASGIMISILWTMQSYVVINNVVVLFGFIILGAAIYVASLFALDKMGKGDYIKSIAWIRKNL